MKTAFFSYSSLPDLESSAFIASLFSIAMEIISSMPSSSAQRAEEIKSNKQSIVIIDFFILCLLLFIGIDIIFAFPRCRKDALVFVDDLPVHPADCVEQFSALFGRHLQEYDRVRARPDRGVHPRIAVFERSGRVFNDLEGLYPEISDLVRRLFEFGNVAAYIYEFHFAPPSVSAAFAAFASFIISLVCIIA